MITIDPYYDVNFYNESKESLSNNGIEFNELISVKTPYNWYIDMEPKPIMVNYDEASNQDKRWLVSKVIPLRPNEEYLLLRRPNEDGQQSILKYIENEPLKELRLNGGVFFHARNRKQLEDITKELPVKIWFLGKYHSKFQLCLCTNKLVKNFLDLNDILYESNTSENNPGHLEAYLNYHILKGDYLIKFFETPYFKNGKFKQVKIRGDLSSRFIIS